ncbi:flippase-like domain-containing protein [bacterium]|nr:flippase-like domain-containing protein [bacterium]
MKNKKVLLKILLSLVLIIFILVKRVNVSDVILALSQARPVWIVLALMLHPLGLLISSFRWRILLKAQSISVPIVSLFQSYLVCNFFNQFLPTQIGGDLVRAYDTRMKAHSGIKSFAIVFVERVSGMSMLFLFALSLSMVRLFQGVPETVRPIYITGGIIGLLGLFAIGLVYWHWPMRIMTYLLGLVKLSQVSQKLHLFHQILRSYNEEDRRGAFFLAFLMAFLLQLNVILFYYFLGLAFHFDRIFQFFDYMVIVPQVQVILLIPFFINGIGLREASWIGFFRFFGIPSATAFAFSVVDYCLYLVFGVIGGIIYAFRK